MRRPPPLPKSDENSPPILAIIALAVGILGGLLAALVPVQTGGVSMRNSSIILITMSAAIWIFGGIVVSIIGIAMRRARSLAIVAAILNVTLAGIFGLRGIKAIPTYFKNFDPKSPLAKRFDARALEKAAAPIPQKAGAMTAADIPLKYLQWGEENLVAGYKIQGQPDSTRDAAMRMMIRTASVSLITDRAPEHRPWAKASVLAVNLAATGVDDPSLTFVKSKTEGDLSRRVELLRKAAAGFRSFNDPPAFVFLAEADLGRDTGDWSPSLQSLREALMHGKLTGDTLYVWNDLLEDWLAKCAVAPERRLLCDAVDAAPGMEDWLKHRLRGAYDLGLARELQKSWSKGRISVEDSRKYYQFLDQAESELTQSWKQNPAHFAAATDMIRVAVQQKDASKMRLWFDRAVAARFDATEAYSEMRAGLRAPFLGNAQAELAFGKSCAATKRFETYVPWELMRSVVDAAAGAEDKAEFYRVRAPWLELQKMFDGYLKAPPKGRRKYYLSYYAIVAGKCAQREVCLRCLDQLDSKLDPLVASVFDVNPRSWPAEYRQQDKAEAPVNN